MSLYLFIYLRCVWIYAGRDQQLLCTYVHTPPQKIWNSIFPPRFPPRGLWVFAIEKKSRGLFVVRGFVDLREIDSIDNWVGGQAQQLEHLCCPKSKSFSFKNFSSYSCMILAFLYLVGHRNSWF